MRRLSMAALLLALAAGALGACRAKDDGSGVATAGGRSSGGGAAASEVSADPQERARQFAACMRGAGIEMPDPGVVDGAEPEKAAIRIEAGSGEVLDKQKFTAAMEKCRRFLPAGGEAGRLSPEALEDARRFAVCMRDNGVPDFPDPDPEGGKFIEGFEVDKDDSAFRDALAKCQHGPSSRPTS